MYRREVLRLILDAESPVLNVVRGFFQKGGDMVVEKPVDNRPT